MTRATAFALHINGRPVAQHSTYIACLTEARERKLVWRWSNGNEFLWDGVEIKKEPAGPIEARRDEVCK